MDAPSVPIDSMAAAVVAAVRPRRVVLFGSHVTGGAGWDSDVDFLIVGNRPFRDERERADVLVRAWEALAPFRVPTDLLLYSEDEVERWADTTNHVVARALRDGRVLYERAGA
jgi:predicted nucleotidyltransferase